MVKIGMLLRLNLKFASKENYKNDIYKKLKYNDRIVEIKKGIVHKKDYKSECIIVLAVLLERERVDFDLQQIKWDRGNITKYILLKESLSDTRF